MAGEASGDAIGDGTDAELTGGAAGESLRYVVAALALGMITYFGSEALFWTYPAADFGLPQLAMTIAFYGAASACALSAVALTGVSGRAGVFLAAALMGFIVEGVIVATMYDAFPVQLVWTPLAWHALLTGWVIIALPRVAMAWSLPRQCGLMILIGLGFGAWAFYWPQERPELPPPAAVLTYLVGCGVLAVVGQIVLDRLRVVPHPQRWVLLVLPVLVALLWVMQTVADPRPARFAWPVLVGLTLWAMVRLGPRGTVAFGGPHPLWRHGPFLLVALVCAVIAAYAVPVVGGLEVNAVVFVLTAPLSLGLWVVYLWRAARRR